jgi:hypothetical protein
VVLVVKAPMAVATVARAVVKVVPAVAKAAPAVVRTVPLAPKERVAARVPRPVPSAASAHHEAPSTRNALPVRTLSVPFADRARSDRLEAPVLHVQSVPQVPPNRR